MVGRRDAVFAKKKNSSLTSGDNILKTNRLTEKQSRFCTFLQFQDDKRINISISPNLSSRKQSSVFHTASFWDKTLPQQQQGKKAKADSYPNNTKTGRKYKNLRKLWFGKTLFNHSHTRNLISWAFSRLSLFLTQNKYK